MTLNVAALEVLVAKGLSAADILEVARALDVRKDATAAERQQRRRDKLKAEADSVTRDVTRDRHGDGVQPSLDKEAPQTPKEIKPTPGVCGAPAHVRAEPLRLAMAVLEFACRTHRKPQAKPTRIPLDWSPANPLPESVAALVALWPPGRVERELEGFRDYWATRSRDAARTDWDRTWWNRIRDQHDRIIRENRSERRDAMGGHRGKARSTSGMGKTVDAAQRYLARRGLAPPGGLGSG